MPDGVLETEGGAVQDLVEQIRNADKQTLFRLRNALGERTVDGMIALVRTNPEAQRVARAVLTAQEREVGMGNAMRRMAGTSRVSGRSVSKKSKANLEF